MGGSSKASSTSSTTTVTKHDTDIDNTSMQGEGIFLQGDGNTIHSADADVLKNLGAGAFDLSKSGLGTAENLGQGAFDLVDGLGAGLLQLAADSSKDSMRFVDQYTERSQLGSATGQNDAIKWVAIAALGVAGFAMMQKGK